MKERLACKRGIGVCGLLTIFAMMALAPPSAQASITEIIDATGDGGGNILSGSAGVAVDGEGNVYVAGQTSNNAFKITPGGVITEIIDATGDGGGNTLAFPFGIAVEAGNVYVTGLFSDNVFRITPGGVVTEIIDATGDGGGNILNAPRHTTADGFGNVYVTGEISQNAFKINSPGLCSTGGTPCTITQIIDVSGDGGGNTFTQSQSIAVDGSGNVYVAGRGTHNAFKITPGGVITEIIDATGDGGGNTLLGAFGIAVDGSGNVYVTGEISNNAFKITSPGTCSTGGTPCTITEIIDVSGDGGGNTLSQPQSIAVDGSGNVYVAGLFSDNAFKINSPGTCSTGGTPCMINEIIDASGDGGGNTLSESQTITVDGSGNVYVAGHGTSNAFKITAPVGGLGVPALSLRGSLIALLLLFVGAAVVGLLRRRSRRVASA